MVIHYTDNKDIVSRMNWYHARCLKTLVNCMITDHDVQAQTEEIYDEMHLDIISQWVKGHQDKDNPQGKLSWQAKLNVQAEKLAVKARHGITNVQQNAPINLLPACHAHLMIDNKN
eukprot:15188077-Ditylum_brightwellii.AAC.1